MALCDGHGCEWCQPELERARLALALSAAKAGKCQWTAALGELQLRCPGQKRFRPVRAVRNRRRSFRVVAAAGKCSKDIGVRAFGWRHRTGTECHQLFGHHGQSCTIEGSRMGMNDDRRGGGRRANQVHTDQLVGCDVESPIDFAVARLMDVQSRCLTQRQRRRRVLAVALNMEPKHRMARSQCGQRFFDLSRLKARRNVNFSGRAQSGTGRIGAQAAEFNGKQTLLAVGRSKAPRGTAGHTRCLVADCRPGSLGRFDLRFDDVDDQDHQLIDRRCLQELAHRHL